MPKKQKINLEKVMASLNTVCPKCGCSITPDKIRRIDFQQMECPECGERFTPKKDRKKHSGEKGTLQIGSTI